MRERFFTWPRAVAVGFFLLFAATFDDGHAHDDGLIYFLFLRRLFGTEPHGVAYQFGSAFWNAPFYLGSQVVALRGDLDAYRAGEISLAVASNLAVVATLYFGWRILAELDLPRGAAVLLLALFGTPLWFYASVWVSYKHAADTLYATAAFYFVLRSTRADARRRHFVAAGICLALLLATRYANIAIWLGVLAVLVLTRFRRAAAWVLASAVIVSLVIFAIPIVRHIPYSSPPAGYGVALSSLDWPHLDPAAHRYALGAPHFIEPVWKNSGFSATAPFKMLFTLHRGLFIWTPLTAFAVIGFVLLLRRDRRNKAFLLALGVSAIALLAVHSLWGSAGAWDGGGSFSQRFLTALFPCFLVGAAEFVRRTGRYGVGVLAACACFSVFVGLVQVTGYYKPSSKDGITRVLGHFDGLTGPRTSRFHRPPPGDSIQNFGYELDDIFRHRWRLYWRLVD